MINKLFLEELKRDHQKHEAQRRQIISHSNNLLFNSKKIIFKLQREDFNAAKESFKEVEDSFKKLALEFGDARLKKEGSYRAAAEEYLEAKTFYQVISGEEITESTSLNFDYESYFAGVCDLIGELVRYATNKAAKGDFEHVFVIKDKAENIMAQLVDIDMTGYLRTKYDQSRGHLRKLEQMAYEIKLRATD